MEEPLTATALEAMEITDQPLTLTVERAAKILGIGRSTAYELVRTGDIPSLRLGRRIVVPTAQLADLLGIAPGPAAEPDHEAPRSRRAGAVDSTDATSTLF